MANTGFRLITLPVDILTVINSFLGGVDQLKDIVAEITDDNLFVSLNSLHKCLEDTTGVFHVYNNRLWFRTYEWVIKPFLQSKFDMNKADNYGRTPLHVASRDGQTDIVEILLKIGADVNKTGNNGRTPLYVASSRGHVDVVRWLLGAKGIDVNKANEYGWTPLYVAYWFKHLDIIKILLSDPRTEVNDDIMTKLRGIDDEEIKQMAMEKYNDDNTTHLKEDLKLRF
jgi:ankyrin repeat protein